jgi:PAS domain S-box-containing protein
VTGSRGTTGFQVVLPPVSTSVGQARHLLRDHLTSVPDDARETAELLVSELVTNALVHAGTPITLRVAPTRTGLRVEVADGSPHHPSPRSYSAMAGRPRRGAGGGGGPARDGKTVWFEVGTPASRATTSRPTPVAMDGEHPGDEAARLARPAPAGTVRVRLRNMPLLLHHAWQQHVGALLREHLLVSLDADEQPAGGPGRPAEPDPIQVHAEVSDALALLAEQVPSAEVGEDAPETVMTETVEPRVSVDEVEVLVPRSSVPHFATLERAVSEALGMADAGLTLTAPTQPEVRALRRWICAEVTRQSEGGEPTPWRPGDLPPPEAAVPLEWDATVVTSADSGLLAIDDTDRILAVSEVAAETLGHEPGALVGERLLALIPERYRQAHVAGFTLHFLTGREPLIERPVTVPALRADGSETLVELTVHREPAPHGRTVFVADVARAD